MHASPRSGSRGTSLLEVLVAIGLLVLLLAIGVPRLNAFRAPYALSGAVRQVAADVQLARQRAIARNTRYRISFNAAAGTYNLEREVTTNTWVDDAGLQRLPTGVTLGTILPSNPVFDTRGMLGAAVTIPVTGATGKVKTVTVNVLGQTTIS